MRKKYTYNDIYEDLKKSHIRDGDLILIRADLGSVGPMAGGANTFINALLDIVGSNGTIVSLAYTDSYFFKTPDIKNTFTKITNSFAGSLPNKMLKYNNSYRSEHPTNSIVAIGRLAKEITNNHNVNSGAYEPIRKIINKDGKCLLVGCVDSSPGFTTTHLVECDLGLSKRMIFSKLNSVYYLDKEGNRKLFRRKDLGLCSKSFYKFYAHYVKREKLKMSYIGNAYSIIIDAKEAYKIDYSLLSKNSKFNICGAKDCKICNIRRWDRLHYIPMYFIRFLLKELKLRYL